MYNTLVLGTNSDYIPSSNAFSIDLISDTFLLDKDILSISKVTMSIYSEYLDSFQSLDKNYISSLITINIKCDYIANDKSINFKILKINNIINICSGDYKHNKNISLYPNILDVGITNISKNQISIYVAYICEILD